MTFLYPHLDHEMLIAKAQTAGYAFATIPHLVLFAFAMKHFVQGLTSGAVKS